MDELRDPTTSTVPDGHRPALGDGAVRLQGLLLGMLLVWCVALCWHFTRHQVDEVCGEVDGSRVCVQRIQTWWNPFGPREDDVRVQVGVPQCGTTYPSPLPVDQEMRARFRADEVVVGSAGGERFAYPTGGC